MIKLILTLGLDLWHANDEVNKLRLLFVEGLKGCNSTIDEEDITVVNAFRHPHHWYVTFFEWMICLFVVHISPVLSVDSPAPSAIPYSSECSSPSFSVYPPTLPLAPPEFNIWHFQNVFTCSKDYDILIFAEIYSYTLHSIEMEHDVSYEKNDIYSYFKFLKLFLEHN